MTYGEYHTYIKLSMVMVDGIWKFDKPTVSKVPTRMKNSEACTYYKNKLRKYWDEHPESWAK